MDYYTKDDYEDELDVDSDRFDELPPADVVEETVANLERRNVAVERFETGVAAREYLLDQVDDGDRVGDGTSTTLNEIGFTAALEDADRFDYLGDAIREIDDDEERRTARREAQTADVWFDSPNAIARSGELVAANASGSGVGAWPFAADRLILASGTNKIVPSYEEAIARLREFAFPLEDARSQDVYGGGSVVGTLLSYEYEQRDGRTQLVLVDERLGF
jgi:hypothetical protein